MTRRVLVTRPEPGASRTAERLRRAGCEPVVVPLTEIVPLPHGIPAGAFGAAAASSANALRHADPAVVRLLSAKPLFAVGDETAAAAREAGFADVRTSNGSATDLVRAVASGADRFLPVAYLCGRVRLDSFEAGLGAEGIGVVAIETYDTLARTPSPQELADLDGAPVTAALVYSAKAAEALAGLVAPRAGAIFRDATFIAISPRVAERLGALSQRVVSAAAPDEDAMFELLLQPGHEPAPFPAHRA